MSRAFRSLIGICVIASALVGGGVNDARGQSLICQVIDTTAQWNAQNTPISIFISNFQDTVAGVELWIQLDRPDAIVFQTNVDTIPDTSLWRCLAGSFPNCTDSVQVFDTLKYWRCTNPNGATPPACVESIQVIDTNIGYDWITTEDYDFIHVEDVEIITGNFDTNSTLMDGWEFVDARSLGGQGFDVKISALANQAALPVTPGIGYPQAGGLMIKLLADVILPDTAQDRVVNLRIVRGTLDNLSFSDEKGNSIGIVTDSVLDTTYFFCTNWDQISGNCLNWIQVSTPPYDSISTRWVLVGTLDTTEVIMLDGSLTILPKPSCICGDVNSSGTINIGDVTYLIARIFSGGPAPKCGSVFENAWGDVNGSCTINIGDVTYLIARIFSGGPAPHGCCAPGP